MYMLMETFTSHSDMGNRVVGLHQKLDTARRQMFSCQSRFRKEVSPCSYVGYSYRKCGSTERMAWVDVVCSDDVHSHTWTIINTDMQYVMERRHLG